LILRRTQMFPLGLLRYLKERADEWCMPPAQGKGFRGDRLAGDVKALEAAGYTVERHPYHGLRLSSAEMPLTREELTAIHAELEMGGKLVFRKVTGSTNDDALDLAREGAEEGTIVIAEHQRYGRGRMGRTWEDRDGEDLLFSMVVRPRFSRRKTAGLTVLAAVAVTEGIWGLYGRRTRIRWPNDVVYRRRKLAGVLVEGGKDRRGEVFYVVGVGVNGCGNIRLNEAVTLEEVCGGGVDRAAALGSILAVWKRLYAELARGDVEGIERRWRRVSATMGKVITIETGRRRFMGRVVDVSLGKGLVLALPDGTRRRFKGEHASVVGHP